MKVKPRIYRCTERMTWQVSLLGEPIYESPYFEEICELATIVWRYQ